MVMLLGDGMAIVIEEDMDGDAAGDGMAVVIEYVGMSDDAGDDDRIAGTPEDSAALPIGHDNETTKIAAKATDVDPAWVNIHPWISAAEGGMVCCAQNMASDLNVLLWEKQSGLTFRVYLSAWMLCKNMQHQKAIEKPSGSRCHWQGKEPSA